VKQIREKDITYQAPGNGLPDWIKEQAESRGYADAVEDISLIVKPEDIKTALDCAAHGDGSHCVMAQAGLRLGAKAIYFYRTTAWIDFWTGPIQRFTIPNLVRRNIIAPFDANDRENIQPGCYPLTAPTHGRSLKYRRGISTKPMNDPPRCRRKVLAHTERVVLAPHSSPDLPQKGRRSRATH
jgi:hypothetical protein